MSRVEQWRNARDLSDLWGLFESLLCSVRLVLGPSDRTTDLNAYINAIPTTYHDSDAITYLSAIDNGTVSDTDRLV